MNVQFLLSGAAHVYYGLIFIAVAGIAILLGANPVWSVAIIALSFGVFVDLWSHSYEH